MSVVTNVILKLPVGEDDKIFEIDRYLKSLGKGEFGECLIGGGHKVVEQPTFIAAFNCFDTNEFLEYLSKIEFEYPEEVQCFICEQEEELYTERFSREE